MPKVKPLEHKNWHEKHQATLSASDRMADRVTAFAGTMRFLYIHFVWWTLWFILNARFMHLTFDKYPYGLLTMILSLEAIVLATLIMISQNRQSARDKIQAEHQYKHQELELLANTELTRQVHELATTINQRLPQPKLRDRHGRYTKS